MGQLDRPAAILGRPAITPLQEGDEHREQLRALLGETVGVPGALAGLAVGLTGEQAVGHQLLQTRRGDRLADADAGGEVVETGHAVERLAQQQHRRAGADDLQRPVDRAVERGLAARLQAGVDVERGNLHASHGSWLRCRHVSVIGS
jgi:hypothetical protein